MSTICASQYQRDPAPPGGSHEVKTEWLNAFYEPGEQPARFSRIVQSWDTANKATELSDYSVCTTWGVMYKKYYLLHVFRQRLNYPVLKRTVIDHAQYHKANTILIEDKASGTQLHPGFEVVRDVWSDRLRSIARHRQGYAAARSNCHVRERDCAPSTRGTVARRFCQRTHQLSGNKVRRPSRLDGASA